ncbi:MAG: YtxH domain-containing protein [Nitrospirae bacterium]|nr:YtxH domain-containing protein [Nitrospirota bacterium]
MDHSKEGRIAAAFLIGGIVGAGVALLFAPQSGEKTRRDIAKAARRVKSDIKERAEDIADSIEDLVDKIGDRISEATSKGKEIEEGVRKNILNAIEEGQHMIDKQKARLSKMMR